MTELSDVCDSALSGPGECLVNQTDVIFLDEIAGKEQDRWILGYIPLILGAGVAHAAGYTGVASALLVTYSLSNLYSAKCASHRIILYATKEQVNKNRKSITQD